MAVLILASKSARRRDMFDMLGLEYETCDAEVDESVETALEPDKLVELLSLRKARACGCTEDAVIIAADTVVSVDGKVFGKPCDRQDAYRMLRTLSGCEHSVYSGFTIIHNRKVYTESVCTKVTFRPLSDREIYYYIDNNKPYDKAGSYGIQEFASIFVKSVSGNLDNVIGLPLSYLEQALKKEFSMSLLDFATDDFSRGKC